jgi:hypothetical protein
MNALKSITRHIMGNRRSFPRKQLSYRTVLVNEMHLPLFQGHTVNISRSGARLSGVPVNGGVAMGQWVRVEFLVIPKQLKEKAIKAAVGAHVWRVEERDGEYIVALKFTRILDA